MIKTFDYREIGERVQHITLDNGLHTIVVPKPGFSKRYAFFAVDYGGADRRFFSSGTWQDTPEGVAHFLEHKMFDTESGNALSELSARGASPNAFTSNRMTAYHFECTDNFYENLELLLDFVTTPYFTPESVEKEQGIIAQEIKMVEDDPDYAVYYGLMKSLFRTSPMRDTVAGTVESISKITAQTLYDCHGAFYTPNNMVLTVVGDVRADEVARVTEKTVKASQLPVPARDYGPAETMVPEECCVRRAMEVSQPIFLAGCKAATEQNGDAYFKQALVSNIACEMLTGRLSPLFNKLYTQGLVANDFSAGFECEAGVAFSVIGGESRDPERVYDEVRRELKSLISQGPDSVLLNRLKKAATGKFFRMLNSFDAVCNSIAAGHFKGYDSYKASAVIAEISDSDIQNFFKTCFDPENMAISIVTPIAEEG